MFVLISFGYYTAKMYIVNKEVKLVTSYCSFITQRCYECQSLPSYLNNVSIGNVFKAKIPGTATHDSPYCTCFGHLGQRDTDRIVSIGQGKYSSDCCVLLSLTFLRTNFANVNEPLGTNPICQIRLSVIQFVHGISSLYRYWCNLRL